MTQTRLTLAVLVALAPAIAGADTTLEFHNSGAGSSGETSRIEIAGGNMRTDTAGPNEAYMIFSAENREFVMVNPSERNYMVFDQEMVQKVAAAQRQAMEQLEKSLAQVPAAQREQMRGMMERMMGGAMPGDAPKPRRYERGSTESVAGYDCERLDIYVGDRLAAEQCVADPDDLGIDDEDFATIRAMQQFAVDITSQFSFMANQVMDYGEPGHDEMPIRYTLHMPMVGKSTGELKSVHHDSIEPSRFQIPEGYTRQDIEMPEIPR